MNTLSKLGFLFALITGLSELVLANGENAESAPAKTPSSVRRNSTNDLIAYLGVLAEHGVIGETELQHFVQGLEEKKLLNPLSQEQAAVSSLHLIHREELESYIDGGVITDPKSWVANRAKLLRWSRSYFRELVRKNARRAAVSEATADLFQQMKFNPVTPGKFVMGSPQKIGETKPLDRAIDPFDPKTRYQPKKRPPLSAFAIQDQVEVELTHAFEMTATSVTQQQWFGLMSANPAHFRSGADQVNLNSEISGTAGRAGAELIIGQPDHPVENITWWSGLVFANQLSEKMGFIPAYDLSEIVFDGDAAQGTLKRISGKLKLNGLNNSIYATQGYRYPTDAEYEFVLRTGRKGVSSSPKEPLADGSKSELANIFPHQESRELIDQSIWHRLNSGQKTHPVAELKPLNVDGHDFFDLVGNVGTFTQNGYTARIPSGIDPFTPLSVELQYGDISGERTRVTEVVVRGGYYDFWPTDYANQYDRVFFPVQSRAKGMGIRLARTTEHSEDEQAYFNENF